MSRENRSRTVAAESETVVFPRRFAQYTMPPELKVTGSIPVGRTAIVVTSEHADTFRPNGFTAAGAVPLEDASGHIRAPLNTGNNSGSGSKTVAAKQAGGGPKESERQ